MHPYSSYFMPSIRIQPQIQSYIPLAHTQVERSLHHPESLLSTSVITLELEIVPHSASLPLPCLFLPYESPSILQRLNVPAFILSVLR